MSKPTTRFEQVPLEDIRNIIDEQVSPDPPDQPYPEPPQKKSQPRPRKSN
jgi:hypothetical protein